LQRLDLPPVIGHRGARAHAPENTLAGFREAARLGCTWIEFDVRLTGDGVPVICHDSRLRRTTDGHGIVSRLPLKMVQAYDAGGGEPVPTLDDALVLAGDLNLGVNIEIKADRGLAAATAAAVADSIGRLGDRPAGILVSSFAIEALAAFRPMRPDIPMGLLLGRLRGDWRKLAESLDCATINLNEHRLTAERAARITDSGYPLLAYTVNDPSRAQTLYAWGVTSVFSDNPDIILESAAPARQGVTG
jgi:glycerophosphoryl diester phosphodiesterase